ncbi:retrotransposon protein [Cucumis melo var. makuwa]|uniref:Retrotransposon protein n=1 Tax=Cucumis melo var. makuwa TaxID=1194695 RepID=A0A5D3CTF6_CUCMM|nr:retrotransposon protein [Cucumis melo var. makuwa]TYK15183.1 retrotransposon protein [Cucumis melo var. makuwa]
MMAEKLPGCRVRATTSYPAAKGLMNKLFSYYDEITYVFDRDKVRGRFAEIFADVDDVHASQPSRASEGRIRSSGSKRKRGSQREVDVEGIHLALD